MRKFLTAGGIVLVLMVLVSGLWVYSWKHHANLNPLVSNEMYRSGQMSPRKLSATINRYHIRTVINLRGANPQSDWYRQEVRQCADMGVLHYDIGMSARQMPDPEMLGQLLDLFETAPRPILIHCQAGADRTGFASAVYLMAEHRVPVEKAVDTLSIRYGHVPVNGFEEMDEFFTLYQSTKMSDFRQWLRERYPAVYRKEKQEDGWN
jgi:protein tyrosine/serine phosphatase